MVNYDDITECIDLYKKFIYANDKHYRYEEIRKDAITIKDLKKPDGFQMPKLGTLKFMHSINDEYWYSCDLPVVVRIKATEDLADIKATYLLGGLTINDPFKFVLLSLMNFDLAQLPAGLKLPAADNYLVKISEAFQPYIPLRRRLDREHKKMEDADWRALIFELIYPLYKIAKSYKFRHNKYTVDAVYVSSDEPVVKEYIVKTIKYSVPSIGVKIAHFDDCHIEGVIKSDTHFCENYYYDVFTMLQSLRGYNLPNETLVFVNQIVPERYRTATLDEVYYRQTVDHVWSPDKVLTVNFFNPFMEMVAGSELSRNSVDMEKYMESSLTHGSEALGLAVKINSTRSNMTVHGMRALNTVRSGKSGKKPKSRRNLEELSALTVSEGSASPVEQTNFMELFGAKEGSHKERALSSTSFIDSLGDTPLTAQQDGAADNSSSSSSGEEGGGASNKFMRSLLKSNKKSKKSKQSAYSHLLSNVSAAYDGALPAGVVYPPDMPQPMQQGMPQPAAPFDMQQPGMPLMQQPGMPLMQQPVQPDAQPGMPPGVPLDMLPPGMSTGQSGMPPGVQQFLAPPMPGQSNGVQQFLPPGMDIQRGGDSFFLKAAATK